MKEPFVRRLIAERNENDLPTTCTVFEMYHIYKYMYDR